jgi:hypothetical protein
MRSAEVPEVEDLGRDWLRAVRGFRVHSPDGYFGVVEAVLCDPEGAPAILGVRRGLFVALTFLVPVDSIACVIPRDRRIFLNIVPKQSSLSSDLGRKLGVTAAAKDAADEGVPGRVCVLDAAVGGTGRCRREECPFWETGGAVLRGGCIVVRSGIDLDRTAVAELLIESRRTLELSDSPLAGANAQRVVRQLLRLDSNGDSRHVGEDDD